MYIPYQLLSSIYYTQVTFLQHSNPVSVPHKQKGRIKYTKVQNQHANSKNESLYSPTYINHKIQLPSPTNSIDPAKRKESTLTNSLNSTISIKLLFPKLETIRNEITHPLSSDLSTHTPKI